MDWLYSIVRIAGASFPVASSLVQLQSEIDSKALNERVTNLEDPVSNIHMDVPELARIIYRELKNKDGINLSFEEEFFKKYVRPLAMMESHGYIEGKGTINSIYNSRIILTDPSFVMYLCALEEDISTMESLIDTVDKCPVGSHLKSNELKEKYKLPTPVISAVFEIFESKGYGICSKGLGGSAYIGRA
ncbi:MAG: hypothetical protein BA873_14170 [Desulfobulbaceae bacterium C00003063]|nr:MAG: hypothetical protein BA873_14170 [Desulfobulbaceae bacterium C00003063]